MPRRAIYILAALLAAAAAGPGGAARACDAPVFRWALEMWPADPYELTVFRRAPLSEVQAAALERLSEQAADRKRALNLRIRVVDAGELSDPNDRRLWRSQEGAQTPWMVLEYPRQRGVARPAWTGTLTPAAAKRLADSPVRRKVARAIADGHSAVWVLLQCGDAEKDAAAARTLATSLDRLERTLELPVPPADEVDPLAPSDKRPPLRIALSSVQVSAGEAAEEAFVRMLLHTEGGLEGRLTAEPVAFCVYGRGRVLWALVGRGISRANIAEACGFLVGRCSCEAKRENPGTDLLVAADWDAAVKVRYATQRTLGALPGAGDLVASAPPVLQAATAPATRRSADAPGAKTRERIARPASAAEESSPALAYVVAGGLGVLAVLLGAAGAVIVLKR